MSVHIALLRAVNVGGKGKLPMADLRELCEAAGFADVRTYIQSGNVVFHADLDSDEVQRTLEEALAERMGGTVRVHVRTPAEVEATLAANPFVEPPPNRVLVYFVDEVPGRDVLATIEGPDGEEVAAGKRELYVHYPEGMGRSKLKLPSAATATGRNLNTVRKLLDIGRDIEGARG